MQPFLSSFKASRPLATMSGLRNPVRARAELASWPQFEGHFQEEEAQVEEGKEARKAKAKAKVWPKDSGQLSVFDLASSRRNKLLARLCRRHGAVLEW